ncbi:hypothetical protein EVAR_98475_1 [Eumeta japonica]|uniref:Uncharacterized protein n=1 Tax=Eumeta variegata TaxID=151549 RepID=A0A4C1YEY8_EUMVA|nr:hypothetical protein EVAR_98475_1 [Eumeta japonica]
MSMGGDGHLLSVGLQLSTQIKSRTKANLKQNFRISHDVANLAQYKNRPDLSVKHHTITEHGREVAGSAVEFHQVSESCGGPLSYFPLPPPLYPSSLDVLFPLKRPVTHW